MCERSGPEQVHGFTDSGWLQQHLLKPPRYSLNTCEVTEQVRVQSYLYRGQPFQFLRSLLRSQAIDKTCFHLGSEL